MKTKFYLRKGSKKSTINFEFRNGVNLKFRNSTGFVVNSDKDWDSNKQKMKLPSSTINAKLINAKLAEFDKLLNDLLYNYKEQLIGVDLIKEIFNKVFCFGVASIIRFQNDCFKPDVEIGVISKDFIKYYDWFLEFYAVNNSPYSKRILTKGTLTTLKNSLAIIKKYIDDREIKTLYFDDINRKFYYDFMTFLTEKKYTNNYIGTVIQKLKTVMGYALDEGKHTNLEFKKSYFSKISEVVNHPYLDLNELKKIEELKLKNSEMNIAKDIFLIGCYTGLRIGDLLSFIKKPNFIVQNNKKFITLKQSKTANVVIIPLKTELLNIMKKYDGNMPNYLHQNLINAHLKSICKQAKINENYQYSRTEGGVIVDYVEPKYKFICTHTARRSFCTNAYNMGMPVQDIMAISGHKSERIFYNYIKVNLVDTASRISNHIFFN